MTDGPQRRPVHGAELKTDIALMGKRAGIYSDGLAAVNTERAYDGQWARYLEWCGVNDIDAFTDGAEPICLYLSYLTDVRDMAPPTLRQVVSAMRWHYRVKMGDVNPSTEKVISRTLSACCRENARKTEQKRPLRAKDLVRIVARVEHEDYHRKRMSAAEWAKTWARDKALLLVGWAGAYRRSELTALRWEHVVFRKDGTARIFLEHSKTDQRWKGHWSEIGAGDNEATCPVAALRKWSECVKEFGSGLDSWVFRALPDGGCMDDRTVNRIVKRYVGTAGISPEEVGGHSMRSGWITDANAANMPTGEIMKHSRHRSFESMQGYNRPHESFVGAFTKDAGL